MEPTLYLYKPTTTWKYCKLFHLIVAMKSKARHQMIPFDKEMVFRHQIGPIWQWDGILSSNDTFLWENPYFVTKRYLLVTKYHFLSWVYSIISKRLKLPPQCHLFTSIPWNWKKKKNFLKLNKHSRKTCLGFNSIER